MRKIPYGVSNFKMLREERYLYVDKTDYIERLENLSERYVFLLRPRRFGKSLFISTLNYYYDRKHAELFDSLFSDLYIHQQPTPQKNNYYMLNFNFSGINTSNKDRCLEGFTKNILIGLKIFTEHYQLQVDYSQEGMPSDILRSFLGNLRHNMDGKLCVLIDEYDHFANELLSFQTEVFEEVISKTGFVRKWYEVLKEGTETIVDRIFATGVSPITLDSLTSGFNVSANITRHAKFNECFGFTESEVKHLFHVALGDIDWETTMPVLKKYYNGYLFSEKGESRLFNSDMVLYYLKDMVEFNQPPADLIDANVSSDYSKIQALFSLRNKAQNTKILEELIETQDTESTITREFSLAKTFTSDDFKSLLFYMGLLTIKNARLVSSMLTIPNYVIKELYFDYYGSLYTSNPDNELEMSDIRHAIEELALEGKITQLTSLIERLLGKLSNRDFIKFDEKYVKLILLTFCMMSKIYYVKSEYEVEDGYIDIALLKRVNVASKYEAIFEMKYIKQSEYEKDNSLLQQKTEEAKMQILKYQTADELRDSQNLKKFVIVVVGCTCYEQEIN